VSELPAAAFLISTLWTAGQTITIDFIDSYAAPWKKAWVEKVVAEMVQPYVNLTLLFGTYGDSADIRITFQHENSAYSRLGTQSTWYKGSSEQPESMNLGWLDEPRSGSFTWKGVTHNFPGCTYCSVNTNGSVIIHEFGHALGMVHEHQNPEGGIQWNEPAVLSYFSGAPNYWDEEQIRFNVLDKYASNLLNASNYDPESIMLYAFPASLTLNGVGTTANSIMSPTDIEWMGKVYGTPPGTEEIPTMGGVDDGIDVDVGDVGIDVDVGDGGVVVNIDDGPYIRRRNSIIIGVSVSVAVLIAVLIIVFVVVIPRKKRRLG
jgi:hypothetical protein